MSTTQPEALRCADALEELDKQLSFTCFVRLHGEAAAELRRLHAYAVELESQVIADCMDGGAGGVSALMGAANAGGKPVAYVDGDHAMRRVLWEPHQAAFDLPVGTKLYTHPSPPEGMAGWTTLPGQLPEPGMPVLLDIGKKFPIRAVWVAKHTVPAHDEADGDWVEYDEATDEVYCPEGWYEWNEHEETHWSVNAAPVAWCELPPLASEAKESK